MGIEPQECHAAADQRAADDDQFAGAAHVTQQQVLGQDHVIRHVGHDPDDEHDRDRAAHRKPIETVGEVDRVAETNDPKINQHQQQPPGHVRDNGVLEERNPELADFSPLIGCHHSAASATKVVNDCQAIFPRPKFRRCCDG
jgi:hypothetical protein